MIKGFSEVKKVMERSAVLFKIKSGENRIIRVLIPTNEILSAYEHVVQINGGWRTIECLGKKECPLCKSGLKSSLRAYIPVLDRTDNKVKIFKASKDVIKFLIALEEEYKDITKYDLKCIRQGEGLNTQYTFLTKDKTEEDLTQYIENIPDIESLVENLSKEEIQLLLDESENSEHSVSAVKAEEDYPF